MRESASDAVLQHTLKMPPQARVKTFFGYMLAFFLFPFSQFPFLQNSKVPIGRVSCGFLALGLTVAPQKQNRNLKIDGVVKRRRAAKSRHFSPSGAEALHHRHAALIRLGVRSDGEIVRVH